MGGWAVVLWVCHLPMACDSLFCLPAAGKKKRRKQTSSGPSSEFNQLYTGLCPQEWKLSAWTPLQGISLASKEKTGTFNNPGLLPNGLRQKHKLDTEMTNMTLTPT